MASNYTEHLGLCQWEATDQVLRTDFNEDNAKIDEVLGELSKTVAQHSTAVEQCTAAIPKLGNCQICVTSYVGNNKYGSANPTQVTFPHKPIWMMVFGGNSHIEAFPDAGYAYNIMNTTDSKYTLVCSRSGNTISWYVSTGSAATQMNESRSYTVMALLDASI